jgi:ferric-dicitrate binding protein FerR (iron transport regulator)
VRTGSAGGPAFQIRTPHAIASVRGTLFAVDITAGRTAVFAAEGSVRVRQIGTIDSVTLRAGQGVDVAPGQPLVVRRWGTPRVEALLARFGR